VKKNIFSVGLQEFRPIIWYGEPVFIRYSQLKTILQDRLGEQFANFLSEPVITREVVEGKGKAHWMSEYIADGISFSSLNEQKKEQTRQQLTLMISKIKSFASELQASEDSNQRQLGELLLLSIEVPALDYVFVDGDKISLVLWGFTSEIAKKTNFQLSRVMEAPILPIIPPPVTPIQEPVNEQIPIEKQLNSDKSTLSTSQSNVKKEVPPPVIPPSEKKKGMPAWLWFIIGALLMFLILFLIWWFFLRNNDVVPVQTDKIPPIDTTKTGTDPNDPTKRKILTDKVNIALKKEASIEKFSQAFNAKFKDNLEIVFFDTLIKLLQVKTPDKEWKKWMDSLKTIPEVRLVFSEALFERSEKKPNDPGFIDAKQSWYFEKIGVYKAWEVTKGSPDIIVAVLDNGFDITHPEFKDKVVKPWNVFTHSDKVFPPQVEGGEHGTHVAASAVGSCDNGTGVAGIAPNCKLMPVQVADENGNMSSLAIVAGLLYAIHQGADVVNMSLGMIFPDEVNQLPENEQKELVKTLYPDEATFWDDLYSFCLENKITIVQAAGNSNILAGIDPAARSKNTIIVSAVDPQLKKAEFSNWGEKSTVSAPGVEIYSAIPNNKYEYLQGTSMASPIVTGAVALMKSKNKNLTTEQIKNILIKTGIPMDSRQWIGPLIQVDKAVLADTSANPMVIPDNPKDLSFAEGLWKSSSDLLNTRDKKKVELYFEIRKDGTGKLTLVEDKGNKCFADLKIKFENGKLLLDQQNNATCKNNNYYYQYLFECVKGDNNEAQCKARQKGTSTDAIQFTLVKTNENLK